jgi:hypothetical protein
VYRRSLDNPLGAKLDHEAHVKHPKTFVQVHGQMAAERPEQRPPYEGPRSRVHKLHPLK